MDTIHPAYLAAIGCAAAALLLLALLVVQKKKIMRLSQQLVHQTTMVEKTRKRLARLQEKHDRIIAFQNNLKTAELTTQLQKTRLNAQSVAPGPQLSGKYRNIRTLAEKGLSVDEIAAVLAVSTHEAQQLLTLAKLGREN